MEDVLCNAIEHQAKKLIERDKKSRFAKVKFQRRYKLRTGQVPAIGKHRSPISWTIERNFDPIYCIKHSKFIAKKVWRKILAGTYKVRPALCYKLAKDSGGHREIMMFSIVDAAIANVFNRKLRDRNRNIQSPFCYSYRKDRGLFDAVLQLQSFLKSEKVYIVQFDFSKYFDSIKHDYIRFLLERELFLVSDSEKFVINSFLEHEYAEPSDYKNNSFKKRTLGVPQGSSLSLFLSNIAAHELDKQLEKINGMFVRFADDIVCVTYNHDDALDVVNYFRAHCQYSGISINYDKSPGIALLKSNSKSDRRIAFSNSGDIGKINIIEEFDYIGHKFTKDNVQISTKAITRIKRRISKLIFIHLLQNPRSRKQFDPKRVGAGFYDWDLVTCINEIRRYINGGLKERRIKTFLEKNERIFRFKGLMSFYPLVTSVDQFAELDGWLLSVLRRALHERSKVLKANFGITLATISAKELREGTWYKFPQGMTLETNAPSFVLAWRAARKSFKQYGLVDFDQPAYYDALEGPNYD